MREVYRPLSQPESWDMLEIKRLGREFYEFMEKIGDSREMSLAKTKIEEAVMWATKHITR
jgi:hypothetical protein